MLQIFQREKKVQKKYQDIGKFLGVSWSLILFENEQINPFSKDQKSKKIKSKRDKFKDFLQKCVANILSKNSALKLNSQHIFVSILEDKLVEQYDETKWEGNDKVNLIDSGLKL